MKISKNIMERTKKSLKKHNIDIIDKNSKICKRFRLFYLIFSFVAFLMVSFYLIGESIRYRESALLMAKFRPTLIFLAIVLAVYLISIVLSLIKKDIMGYPFNFVGGILAAIATHKKMYNVNLGKPGLNPDWWWRHGLPIIIAMFLGLILVGLQIKGRLTLMHAYNNMVDKLYKNNRAVRDMNEDEWLSFLDSYDPIMEEQNRRRRKKGLPEYKGFFNKDEAQQEKEE